MRILNITLLIMHISISNSILIKVTGQKKLCFDKTLKYEDQLTFNYLITSSKGEKLRAKLFNAETGQVFWEVEGKQNGEFKSDDLFPGDYSACFYPLDDNQYYISFRYFTRSEAGIIIDLAKDKELKHVNDGINQLKQGFQEFEMNLNYIVDRRSRHTIILQDIIKALKRMTGLKALAVALLSIFQVFIIRKFFGPDKRVTKVSGAFSDKL